MVNEEHVAILRQGVEIWNEWRKNNIRIVPVLSGANFVGANLSRANLTDVDLSKASLNGTTLFWADLSRANLIGANLTEANFSGANLTEANFSGANLTEADLGEANFTKANFSGANLTEADLSYANFTKANFSGTQLSYANLTEADLSYANLTEADLSYANLTEADLSYAKIDGINLKGANINETNLNEAYLDNDAYLTEKKERERLRNTPITGLRPTVSQQDFFTELADIKLSNQQTLKGVLLYTDEDSSLKEYIRRHFQDFHKLSGNWCEIFILENPSKEWRNKNLSLIERLNLKFTRKIDKSEAYDIARELKIDISQIPCLIFFGEEINLHRLIIPIKQAFITDLPKYFRELFAMLEKIIAGTANLTDENLSGASAFETISHRFDDIINYLDNHAQEIADEKQYLYQQQIIITQKLVMEDKSTSKTFNLQNAQIAGGLVNAETVNAHKIGGNIHNTDNQDRSN